MAPHRIFIYQSGNSSSSLKLELVEITSFSARRIISTSGISKKAFISLFLSVSYVLNVFFEYICIYDNFILDNTTHKCLVRKKGYLTVGAKSAKF